MSTNSINPGLLVAFEEVCVETFLEVLVGIKAICDI